MFINGPRLAARVVSRTRTGTFKGWVQWGAGGGARLAGITACVGGFGCIVGCCGCAG